MKITNKNWQFNLFTLFMVILFIILGCWQLWRASEKRTLLHLYTERMHKPPVTIKELTKLENWRFHQVSLQGKFDNEHTLLLDNKTFHGQVGYEVYTPFYLKGHTQTILVNRGFIPLGKSRKQLPNILKIEQEISLIGMLNQPPRYFALGKMVNEQTTWPLRVAFINLNQIESMLGKSIAPYVVNIHPKNPLAFKMEWEIVTMPPARHTAYACQWFALALTLLILSFAFNRRSSPN